MAYDAGMTRAVAHCIRNRFGGARVEKITQPERDEINIYLHRAGEKGILILSAASSGPRVSLSQQKRESPPVPPAFCMQLRKYLSGGYLKSAETLLFERVIKFTFSARDDMGFPEDKYIYAEIMGKYSNLILTDAEDKIIGALRYVDISSNSARALLCGMKYELPPSQNKLNILSVTEADIEEKLSAYSDDYPLDKALLDAFCGISALTARELAYRCGAGTDIPVGKVSRDKIISVLRDFNKLLKEENYKPCLLAKEGEDGYFEYSFFPITQYGREVEITYADSVTDALEGYFAHRDRDNRKKQKAHSLTKLLTNAENRITKKIDKISEELEECKSKSRDKRYGDLITENIYRIKRGESVFVTEDYYEEGAPTVKIPLDSRLTPAANAQKYYKKYSKKKTAEEMQSHQLELAKKELMYIETVWDALNRAEGEKELSEIRLELENWGYGKSLKKANLKKNLPKIQPKTLVSPNGYTVIIGKNNIQNDHITFTLADKNDYWFHVKNMPGSHVLLVTKGEEPEAEDFTFAAVCAAENSKAEGDNIAVDYTKKRNIKKPAGAKPGFVVYETYYTAYVSPAKYKEKQKNA